MKLRNNILPLRVSVKGRIWQQIKSYFGSFYHPPLNYLFKQCRSKMMHYGILNIFTKTIMRLVNPPKFYINIVSNFSWVLHSSREKSKRKVMQILGGKQGALWSVLDRKVQMNSTAIPWKIFSYSLPKGCSLRTSSPIWASEVSLARTREWGPLASSLLACAFLRDLLHSRK